MEIFCLNEEGLYVVKEQTGNWKTSYINVKVDEQADVFKCLKQSCKTKPKSRTGNLNDFSRKVLVI